MRFFISLGRPITDPRIRCKRIGIGDGCVSSITRCIGRTHCQITNFNRWIDIPLQFRPVNPVSHFKQDALGEIDSSRFDGIISGELHATEWIDSSRSKNVSLTRLETVCRSKAMWAYTHAINTFTEMSAGILIAADKCGRRIAHRS